MSDENAKPDIEGSATPTVDPMTVNVVGIPGEKPADGEQQGPPKPKTHKEEAQEEMRALMGSISEATEKVLTGALMSGVALFGKVLAKTVDGVFYMRAEEQRRSMWLKAYCAEVPVLLARSSPDTFKQACEIASKGADIALAAYEERFPIDGKPKAATEAKAV